MIGNSDTVNTSGGDVVSVGRTNDRIGIISGIMDLNSRAIATLAGSNNTINAGQGNATVGVAGNNDVFNGGHGDILTLTGNADVVNLSDGTICICADSAVSISGS